jgi:ABC-type transport system substrate-binding protein
MVTTGMATAAAALLAACGSNSGTSTTASKATSSSSLITPPKDTLKQAKTGGTLKLNMFQDVQGLDPGFANLPNESVKIFVYSWLMAYEAGHLGPTQNKVIPDVGQSWEFSPDGLQLTVKVRPGMKFHNKAPVNGRALDIDDVVFSYNRMAAKGAPRGDIVNAANPNAPLLSIKSADANSIVVKLK